jgi:hypothetical protein
MANSWKPMRAGWFNYDRGKWGFVNKNGGVDWDAKTPGANGHIFNYNNIAQKIAHANAPKQLGHMKDWAKDAEYQHRLGALELGTESSRIPFKQERQRNLGDGAVYDGRTGRFISKKPGAELTGDYWIERNNLLDSNERNLHGMGGNMASRGIHRSGARNNAFNGIQDQLKNDEHKLDRAAGQLRNMEIEQALANVNQQFVNQRQELDRNARDAYKDTDAWLNRPDSGFFKRDGVWFNRNKNGVETSITRVGNVNRQQHRDLWRYLNKDKVAQYNRAMRGKPKQGDDKELDGRSGVN